MSRRSLLEWCLLLLVVALYLPTMAEIGHAWSTHRYAAHGVFVPLLGGLVLWCRRHRLGDRPAGGCRTGLVLLGAGLGLLGVGHATQSVAAHIVSVVLAVSGVALWRYGAGWTRGAGAPFGFLLFMLPLPRDLVDAVTLPVQHFTAGAAAALLGVLHIPVAHAGLMLHLADVDLRVDEGCNGIRFLMVLLVVTTAFALIHVPTPARQSIVIATAIPAAMLANVIRVASIAAAAHLIGPGAPSGVLHDAIGKTVWALALAATLGFGVILGRAEVVAPAIPPEPRARAPLQ